MMRFLLPLLLVSLCAGTARAADAPHACAALSEADAAKLLGGPLGEVSKFERKPAPENGNDHQTACGYFPKGYNIDKAEGPPVRGILVTFHTLLNNADAKRYYGGILDMQKDMAQAPGGATVTPVSGIGEGAYLKPFAIANSPSKITTLTFLKANVMASVQVWKNAAPVDDIAAAAAKQILTKLP